MTADAEPHLILTRSLVAEGDDPRQAQRAARSGALTRVRRGAFVESRAWEAVRQEHRHRCLVLATVGAMRSPPLVSHESAATLQGIPLIGGCPDRVQVTAPIATGGRSSTTVRRHGVSVVPPGQSVAGIAVTVPARTVIDLARTRSFASGLAAADYVLGAGLATTHELAEQAVLAGSGRGTRRARLVVARADGRAESVGESLSRAQMYTLGLPIPDLQREFLDADGFVGRVDFWWEELRLVGEFDGRTKYARAAGAARDGAVPRMRSGTPADVLWAEKRREDRLRRMGCGVVRWTWGEARRAETLAAVLGRAGVIPGR